MSTVHDPRYIKLIQHLEKARKGNRFTQEKLAKILGWEQSAISKVVNYERRLDVIELIDWIKAIQYDPRDFLNEVGLLDEVINTSTPALPMPGRAKDVVVNGVSGVSIDMQWQRNVYKVFIPGLDAIGYLRLEDEIKSLYVNLNDGAGGKNREAIFKALKLAIHRFPDVNPSDLYHHIVYRLYLRDYTKTQADRSWVRAGGEALELFLETHYNAILSRYKIQLVWLKNDHAKKAAMSEMGISDEVGGSKLDIALYGEDKGKRFIFGGIHVKASLAERVSDDIPCSKAMMRNGFVSYLLTLDAKSYPPPNGDLVNRGELGSVDSPSDKRKYIESHGDFTACFSYNLRTNPSPASTLSGRKIYVSTFNIKKDYLRVEIAGAWNWFCSNRRV